MLASTFPLVHLNLKGTGGRIRESETSAAGWKRKPKEFEEEIEGLEDYQSQLQEVKDRWEERRSLRNINIGTLMENHSKDNIKKWLLMLWDNKNDRLWQYFKDMGLPLELTRVGEYEITLTIRKTLLENLPATITSNWKYTQIQKLSKELLISATGEGTTSVQAYNLGPSKKGHETTRIISAPKEGRKIMETQGYNTYRNFLANFITSRLKQLNTAIEQSDAQGE